MNINNSTGDTWDSRKTSGSGSSEVEYPGKSLSPNTTYYWKVRIWDICKYSMKATSFTGKHIDGDREWSVIS
jgi:hypothetical protein